MSELPEMVKSGRVSSLGAHSQPVDEFFLFFVKSMCMGFTKVSEMLSILIRSGTNHDGSKTNGFLLAMTSGAFSSYRIRHNFLGAHRFYD